MLASILSTVSNVLETVWRRHIGVSKIAALENVLLPLL